MQSSPISTSSSSSFKTVGVFDTWAYGLYSSFSSSRSSSSSWLTCWKKSQSSASSNSEEDPLLREVLLGSWVSLVAVIETSRRGASNNSGIGLKVRTEPRHVKECWKKREEARKKHERIKVSWIMAKEIISNLTCHFLLEIKDFRFLVFISSGSSSS